MVRTRSQMRLAGTRNRPIKKKVSPVPFGPQEPHRPTIPVNSQQTIPSPRKMSGVSQRMAEWYYAAERWAGADTRVAPLTACGLQSK